MHKKISINKLLASDWFDSNYFGEFPDFPEKVISNISEQKHKISDVNLSSRILNHWYDAGIINDDRPNGKGWKKFSLAEIVWIEIIRKLRNFGFDLKKIKKVKDEIDLYNFDKNYPHSNLIEFYILVVLQFKAPFKVIVFESGQTEILRQIDIDLAQEMGSFSEDFISIDLNQILIKLLKRSELKPKYVDLTSMEKPAVIKELENAIRNEELFSIKIDVKDNEYIIDENLLFRNKKRAISFVNTLQYADLIEQKRGGKSIFKVMKKKKIGKG